MTLLDVEELDAFYGKAQALHSVSLEVEAETVVAIIGPNGAGKTTLLNALSGLVPYHGEVRFDGQALPRRPSDIVERGLIHCPEGRHLFPYLNVHDNLTMGAYLRHDAEIDRDLRVVQELFPRLAERRHQPVHTLSGGEQQMVAIGRALMSSPQLLMLDEPTLGLAPIVCEDISRALGEIRERFAMAILLAEQNTSFAFAHAERVHLLETGQLVRTGSGPELQEDPYVRQAYLGR
ncbi:MAG: ABC transporter ATP-binding protein [Candidatus Bipolaricaulia bacterium]